MIGWTIQTYDAWITANETGILMGNEAFVEHSFLNAYLWLMNQMEKRVPRYNGEFPIWFYQHKPDLRHSGYLPRGTRSVLLKADLEPESYLVSDFMTWHLVLNNITFTKDDDGLENIGKEESWERIFDFEFLKEINGERCILPQITTGAVPVKNIKLIREFIAK
jgi:hypothetical protein